MKEGDFTAAWGGIAGAQATLGLLLERLPPQTVAALTSREPGEALQPAQGPARAGRRRRPRARRPARPAAARAAGPPQAQPLRGPPAPARRPHAGARRRAEGPPDHPTKGHRMSDLRITAGPLEFGADWVEDAPEDLRGVQGHAAVPQQDHPRPLERRVGLDPARRHARPTSTSRTTPATRRPGRSCSTRAATARPRSSSPTAAPASRASSASSPGNHFLTVTEGADQLRELGRMVLWEGAQDVVFANA